MSSSATTIWGVFFVICCLLVSPTSIAAKDDCRPPDVPQLPSQITNQSQANALSVVMGEYAKASEAHLACIAAFANANLDSMTAGENTALKTRYKDYLTATIIHKSRWNKIYGTFQANR